jgi:hypothetical protein
LSEGSNVTKIKCKLFIPQNHIKENVDSRDIRLAAIDSMRQKAYYGRYAKGSIDISKQGRYYLLEYVKEMGWK